MTPNSTSAEQDNSNQEAREIAHDVMKDNGMLDRLINPEQQGEKAAIRAEVIRLINCDPNNSLEPIIEKVLSLHESMKYKDNEIDEISHNIRNEAQRKLSEQADEFAVLLNQKESQLTSLAGQLHTKEVEYEMMKEERKGLYSSEQIERAFLEFWMTENFQLASGLRTFLTNLKQQKEGK